MLFETMRTRCDLSFLGPDYIGYHDGPRACRRLTLLGMNAPRDAVDKSFYRTATSLIQAHPLQDGSSADEFGMRALRFVTRVNPLHPQLVTAGLDGHLRFFADDKMT